MAYQGHYFIQHTIIFSYACRQGYLIVVVISSFDRDGNLSSSFLIHIAEVSVTARKTGFSVLLQFPNLSEFKKNLEMAYEIANRCYPAYFQFQ